MAENPDDLTETAETARAAESLEDLMRRLDRAAADVAQIVSLCDLWSSVEEGRNSEITARMGQFTIPIPRAQALAAISDKIAQLRLSIQSLGIGIEISEEMIEQKKEQSKTLPF